MRSPPRASAGARARQRASRSPIGRPTRRGAGSAWAEIRATPVGRRNPLPVADEAKLVEYRVTRGNGQGNLQMVLLVVYIVLMIIGDFFAYLIGLVVERAMPG